VDLNAFEVFQPLKVSAPVGGVSTLTQGIHAAFERKAIDQRFSKCRFVFVCLGDQCPTPQHHLR
jgi:hypothetical protein